MQDEQDEFFLVFGAIGRSRMTDKPVWFASTSLDVNASKPIWPIGFHDKDQEKLSLDERAAYREKSDALLQFYRSGTLIPVEDVGPAFSLIPERKKPAAPQHFMNFGGAYNFVTGDVRRLLEGLNVGQVHFDKVDVLNAKQTEPLWGGVDLHLLQVLNCRREVLIEESQFLRKRVGTLPDGTNRYSIRATDRDNVLVLPPIEKDVPQFWLDDRFDGALFVSDAIVKVLKTARLTRGWGFRRCANTEVF